MIMVEGFYNKQKKQATPWIHNQSMVLMYLTLQTNLDQLMKR